MRFKVKSNRKTERTKGKYKTCNICWHGRRRKRKNAKRKEKLNLYIETCQKYINGSKMFGWTGFDGGHFPKDWFRLNMGPISKRPPGTSSVSPSENTNGTLNQASSAVSPTSTTLSSSSICPPALNIWKYLKEIDLNGMCENLCKSCACNECELSRTQFSACAVLARTFLLNIIIRPLYKFLGRSKGKQLLLWFSVCFKSPETVVIASLRFYHYAVTMVRVFQLSFFGSSTVLTT